MFAAAVLVFLSYSTADAPSARDIEDRLRTAGCEVWSDVALSPGDDWRREVERAIERADVVVALVSAEAIASLYARDEWAYARDLRKRIVPIPIGNIHLPMIFARLNWGRRDKLKELCREGK